MEVDRTRWRRADRIMQAQLKALLRHDALAAVAVGLAIMWLVVGAFGFLGTVDTGKRIADLEGQVSSLQADLESKTVQLADLQSEVQNKSTEIDDLGSQIDTRDAEIAILQAQIDVITQISDLESQISELQSQVEAKNSQISDLEETVSVLESEIADLEQQLGIKQWELRVLGVYFSRASGCEDQIVHWIGKANSSIHILTYSFTLDSIGNALVEAHERGVEVKVVFEERQLNTISEHEKLTAAGVEIRVDTNSRYMHHKVMIVDGVIVITGSYDWTETAETYNDENLIVISSGQISSVYEEEFSRIWDLSRP